MFIRKVYLKIRFYKIKTNAIIETCNKLYKRILKTNVNCIFFKYFNIIQNKNTNINSKESVRTLHSDLVKTKKR